MWKIILLLVAGVLLFPIFLELRSAWKNWAKKTIKKIDRKETSIKQWVDDRGMTIIEMNCTFCGKAPCKHMIQDFDKTCILALPKISKDPKRAKIRENVIIK